MSDTPQLGLPQIEAAQAQKHVTHNEALAMLDALVQLSALARDMLAPPAAPVEGARWIVGAGASDAFSGRDQMVATWRDGAWRFFAPRAGWIAFVEAEASLCFYDGAQWRDAGATFRALDNLKHVGVGAAADDANRLVAKTNAALFTARATAEGGTGDVRVALNKAASANTASHVYQVNYSGRAETGLAGADGYRVRVSTDGAQWSDALLADAATGAVACPAGLATKALSVRSLDAEPALVSFASTNAGQTRRAADILVGADSGWGSEYISFRVGKGGPNEAGALTDEVLRLTHDGVTSAVLDARYAPPSWTAYAPVVTTGAGSLGAYTAVGRHYKVGKLVHVLITISISNNGSGSAYLAFSLPFTPQFTTSAAGREFAIVGFGVFTTLYAGNPMAIAVKTDGSYPAQTGAQLAFSCFYEVA